MFYQLNYNQNERKAELIPLIDDKTIKNNDPNVVIVGLYRQKLDRFAIKNELMKAKLLPNEE